MIIQLGNGPPSLHISELKFWHQLASQFQPLRWNPAMVRAMTSFMAVAHYNIFGPPSFCRHNESCNYSSLCSQFTNHRQTMFACIINCKTNCMFMVPCKKRKFPNISCSAANKPSPSTEISSAAKIRSEVISPFRSVRMFFYLAFMASGALGGLIAATQLTAALANPSRAAEVLDIAKGLGIDIGAVCIFAFLYSRENNAKNAQLAKLSREESLSNLKLRVNENRIISIGSLRGAARLVICAGTGPFILESFRLSEPFTQRLLERGVLVVPFATDGNLPSFEFDEREEMKDVTNKRKRLWQLAPVYVFEWSKWLEEQKKLAGISPESPVYLSLRMDGRVRGSGVGYPPWNAFVAQLPPIKGMWSGPLDGMDGRVL